MNGLVLTAGGARGAYQAGVLMRIGESKVFRGKPSPFPIMVGASAGAINSAYLSARSDDFAEATRRLSELWSELRIEEIYRTDVSSLGRGAARWIRDLSFGGVWGGGEVQSLLDASPLRKLLMNELPLNGIAEGIKAGHLYATAVSATSYYSGKSIIFIEGKSGHPVWNKVRRSAVSVPITVEHVLASCAIPVVFQPIKIAMKHGDFYFGDGALRLVNPLSPAIRLGASRVFAIGIRSQTAAVARMRRDLSELGEGADKRLIMARPPLAQVFGITLNSIFLDHLDTDLDHLLRINELLKAYKVDALRTVTLKEPMFHVDALAVHPSVDLADIAEKHARRMPRFLRYLMDGLGTSQAQSSDLISYLLFDSEYTSELVRVGYADADQRIDEIETFLNQP